MPIAATAIMYGDNEMPSAPTISGFWTPAFTTRPKAVRLSRSQIAATQRKAMRISVARYRL